LLEASLEEQRKAPSIAGGALGVLLPIAQSLTSRLAMGGRGGSGEVELETVHARIMLAVLNTRQMKILTRGIAASSRLMKPGARPIQSCMLQQPPACTQR